MSDAVDAGKKTPVSAPPGTNLISDRNEFNFHTLRERVL
jgi:hypothetical protein